jgi:hypothetical chaperone protein
VVLGRPVRSTTTSGTIAAAGLTSSALSTRYFTGGSSGMRALREAFATAFPQSRVVVGDLFGSVVSAARRFT